MHSQDPIDVWTAVHHLYGAYFFSVFKLSLYQTLYVALLWEACESTDMGIALWNDVDYGGDSWRNRIVDVLATVSGWLLASHM